MKDFSRTRVRLLLAILICLVLTIFYSQETGAGNKDWEPTQLLVQKKPGSSNDQISKIFKEHGSKIKDFIPQIETFVLQVPPDKLEIVQNALSRNPLFKSVSKDHFRYLHYSINPNDPYYPGQWHLEKIQAPQTWAFTLGNGDVVIAVIDDGIAAVADIYEKVIPGINIIEGGTETTNGGGHGTPVAGIISATTNNAMGVAGVAWNNKLLPVKVYTETGYTTCSAIIKGIVWAADNSAKVINMSFGGPSECAGEKSAIDYAWNKGAVLVASAGNYADTTPIYPAAYSNVLGVAATNPDDTIASFSSYGSWINVAAPGRRLYTTYSNGAYSGFSGTSASAPVVSGIAGLIMSANPTLLNSQVKSIIEKSADDLGAPGFDSYYGWGRVNAYKAILTAIGSVPPPPDTTAPTVSISYPSEGATVSGSISINVSASDNVGVAKVELYLNGALYATDTTEPFSFVWDTTKVNNGVHTLQAKAYDTAGNSSLSPIVNVNVYNFIADTTPPSVVITSPANGSTLTRTTKITVNASDNVQVKEINIYVNNKRLSTESCSTATCSLSINWNTRNLPKGTYTITADAYDTSWNSAISSSVVVYK